MMNAETQLTTCMNVYLSAQGETRREAARQIRALVRCYPLLGDLLPDEVWAGVYRVRAMGTVPPATEPATH
jgi:hypothetical protein